MLKLAHCPAVMTLVTAPDVSFCFDMIEWSTIEIKRDALTVALPLYPDAPEFHRIWQETSAWVKMNLAWAQTAREHCQDLWCYAL